jgi:hypothetical protein
VTYANRFVESRDYAFAERGGGVRTPFPGTPPDRPVWTRIRQVLSGTFPDNPVIGVQRFGEELAAVTESPTALTFDPDTLETTGRIDLTAGLDRWVSPALSVTAARPRIGETAGISNGKRRTGSPRTSPSMGLSTAPKRSNSDGRSRKPNSAPPTQLPFQCSTAKIMKRFATA